MTWLTANLQINLFGLLAFSDGAGDDNQQLTPRRSARIMVRSLLDIDNSNGNGNDDQANPNKISNRRKTSV